MASPADQKPAESVVSGHYEVHFSRPLPGAGGGLAAFACTDTASGRRDLMAVQARPHLPPRARVLGQMAAGPIADLLCPVGHGAAPGPKGEGAYFVICEAPPGPALSAATQPHAEADLIERVLRPAAFVLEALRVREVTHRAIRPDNIFRAGDTGPATLGSAWAVPPASMQPAIFEPPYAAMCLPAGRGDGIIADDVYALGVTLIALALGKTPLQGLDEAAITRRKLEMGSFAALVGQDRLPGAIADLARSMLAENPEHRPTPQLLMDPPAARARRVAARPIRRAQWVLDIGGVAAGDLRSAAHAIGRDPGAGLQVLRSDAFSRWLRRGLGDPAIAVRLEEMVHRGRNDGAKNAGTQEAQLVMRAVSALDSLAPLCWRGVAVWPDGIGPALAAARAEAPATAAVLEDLVGSESATTWYEQHPEPAPIASAALGARQWALWLRGRAMGVGVARVIYALNPLLPCESPLLSRHWVAQLGDLLPALEAAANAPDRPATPPIDRHVAAFIAARFSQHIDAELAGMSAASQPEEVTMTQLRVLSRLQARLHPAPLPGLATWVADTAGPALAMWRNRQVRARIESKLKDLAKAGRFAPMLTLLDDAPARLADQKGAKAAAAAVARLDAELAAIADGADKRAEFAARLGQEIASGLGIVALTASILIAAIG